MKYFLGILGVALGVIIILKTEWIIQNFGTSAWAESKMGTSGGSRLLYKLIGLIIIVIAVLGATDMLGGIVLAIFGRLFGL